ncbi:MAG: hypothetical protein ACYCTL_09825 [Acidimicrobiales bacterium]|jgi:hypothetical protein
MAELSIEGEELVLHLSKIERVEAVHGDLRVPLSAVTGVDVLEDAHGAADMVGLKVGTRIPRVTEVASVRGGGKKIFAVVHHDTPRGVQVSIQGGRQDGWIVGCSNPEALVATIRAGLPALGSDTPQVP